MKNARYCAMTLSGNAGRVIVRDWIEGRFEELLANIEAWFEDLSIVSRDGSTVVRNHKFFSLLAAPVRDLKDISKPMAGILWYAALKRQPIPHHFIAQTLLRIRTDIIMDEPARHARYGLLKAYYNRIKGGAIMTEKLNTEIDNPAYLCGRIMALLADIQQVAMPNVGAGVIQRYYGAASATPGLVLGRLVRLAQIGHLPKIENDNLRYWFEKQMAQIWQRLDAAPPAVLDLEGQTLFAMGYYQQKAQRYQKSEEKENNN
ncbi:type I-C CRISPR-associated protein Cas8c/Csd1 [candidate division KSB1 bacterium]|nr:type I-C CRISPR-associated protein Cas8c/Csd1 [candidate division KSB1 bacterium]